jgi:hypothetical protein
VEPVLPQLLFILDKFVLAAVDLSKLRRLTGSLPELLPSLKLLELLEIVLVLQG